MGGWRSVRSTTVREDPPTAEISRSQVWQWIKHGAALDDGRTVTAALVNQCMAEELAKIKGEVGEARYNSGHFSQASDLFVKIATSGDFIEFLTIPAYQYL